MKKINQVLSIILAILMVMSTIPITATAATDTYSDVCGENLIWTLDESTGTLTISGTGDMYDGEFSYPSWNANLVESVIISEGVTSIGELAFCYNTNIKNVSIADSVTDIGDEAFYNCTGLTDIVIGEGVTNIGDSAFYNCTGLTNIVIGTGVTKIGDFAFEKCSNLETVTIYNAVEEICRYAFNGCSKLTDVYYWGTEAEWNAITKATLLCADQVVAVSKTYKQEIQETDKGNGLQNVLNEMPKIAKDAMQVEIINFKNELFKDNFENRKGLEEFDKYGVSNSEV